MVEDVVAAYPLMRGAGLMLISVGLGFLIAWFSGSRWYVPAIAGAVVGFTCTGFAGVFEPRLPAPTVLQTTALVLSIVVEAALIVFVVRRYSAEQQRLILAVLAAVGIHFFIMIPSLGPSVAVLGTLTVLNAAAGWYFPGRLNWRVAGCIDSALKIAVGTWMFVNTTTL